MQRKTYFNIRKNRNSTRKLCKEYFQRKVRHLLNNDIVLKKGQLIKEYFIRLIDYLCYEIENFVNKKLAIKM